MNRVTYVNAVTERKAILAAGDAAVELAKFMPEFDLNSYEAACPVCGMPCPVEHITVWCVGRKETAAVVHIQCLAADCEAEAYAHQCPVIADDYHQTTMFEPTE